VIVFKISLGLGQVGRHMTGIDLPGPERLDFLFGFPGRRTGRHATKIPSRRPLLALSPILPSPFSQPILNRPISRPDSVKCGTQRGKKDSQLLPFQPFSPCRENKGDVQTCNKTFERAWSAEGLGGGVGLVGIADF